MNDLKKYLSINAIFSFISGSVTLLFSNFLNSLFNIQNVYVFPIIGINLLIFSFFVFFVSKKHSDNKTLVNLITVLDIIRVTGSFVIIVSGIFSISKNGNVITGIVAIWIAFLAYKQYINNR